MACFAERALLHSGLHTSLRRRARQQATLIHLRRQLRNEARREWLLVGMGSAAACVRAAGFLWLNAACAGVKVDVLASKDCSSEEFCQGVTRRIKTLPLAQGSIHLRLPSGVSLEITSPAQLNLMAPMHVRLVSGRVTADVRERGKGFVMETPQTRLVVRGTRFGVDASDPLRTDVVVFQGEVEVYECSKKAPTVLQAGNAGSVVQRRVSRIVSISGSGGSNE